MGIHGETGEKVGKRAGKIYGEYKGKKDYDNKGFWGKLTI